jgi:hypothetical protein
MASDLLPSFAQEETRAAAGKVCHEIEALRRLASKIVQVMGSPLLEGPPGAEQAMEAAERIRRWSGMGGPLAE